MQNTSKLYLNFENSDTGKGMYHLHHDIVDVNKPLLYLCDKEASDIPSFRTIEPRLLHSRFQENSDFLICPDCIKQIPKQHKA